MRIRTATLRLSQPSAWRDPDAYYRHLACAVVLHALKESIRGDERACSWLLSEGLSLMDLVGIYVTKNQVVRLIEQKKAQSKRAAQTGERIRLIK